MVKHQRGELTYQGLLTALRADIRRGHFAPGARLKVAELTKRYQTSAMPVRQALVELQSQGLSRSPPIAAPACACSTRRCSTICAICARRC